jgi:hypothetical protein
VRFNLATSAVDLHHRAGDLVTLQDGLQRLPPIATVLAPKAGGVGEVQVLLDARITEVGTLEMHCVAVEAADAPPQRWKLEFQLRGDATAHDDDAPVAAHPRLGEALAAIARVYGGKKQGVDSKEVRQLRATLERLLGERATWDAALLRTLFGALLQGARRRRRSSQHERAWFNLAGFTLRPGFGDPLDGWRMAQMWELFGPGIAHSDDSQQWSEWWTLWRRIAGGLDAGQQQMVYDVIAYYLQPPGGTDIAAPEGPPMLALDELLRMAASFERIQPVDKMRFGCCSGCARAPRPSSGGRWAVWVRASRSTPACTMCCRPTPRRSGSRRSPPSRRTGPATRRPPSPWPRSHAPRATARATCRKTCACGSPSSCKTPTPRPAGPRWCAK